MRSTVARAAECRRRSWSNGVAACTARSPSIILAAAVRRRYREFIDDFESLAACQDRLWEVIQEEWREMDPAKLYSISEHKYDIAKQVIREGGKPILKECHGGARKRTNDAIKAARKK